jgi:hypothetical protein
MIMELFFWRWIADNHDGKILPSIINILRARTMGLGILSLAKGDQYVVEVQDNNNVLAKHIVKAHIKYCSCQEWQLIRKPCQHALVVIIAQLFRDFGMEYFMDDEHLADRGSWPKVPFATKVGARILERVFFHNLDRLSPKPWTELVSHNSVQHQFTTQSEIVDKHHLVHNSVDNISSSTYKRTHTTTSFQAHTRHHLQNTTHITPSIQLILFSRCQYFDSGGG